MAVRLKNGSDLLLKAWRVVRHTPDGRQHKATLS